MARRTGRFPQLVDPRSSVNGLLLTGSPRFREVRLEGRRRLCRLKQSAAADAHLSTAWQQNAMRIADFLSKANPNWSKNTPRRSNKTPPVDDERGRRAVKRVFSRICGSLPAPVADPTYGTGRFLC